MLKQSGSAENIHRVDKSAESVGEVAVGAKRVVGHTGGSNVESRRQPSAAAAGPPDGRYGGGGESADGSQRCCRSIVADHVVGAAEAVGRVVEATVLPSQEP